MGESRQKVLYREIKTYYGISEMLECGHRYESLTLLADALVAKHRVCPKCQQASAFPPKKQVASERLHQPDREGNLFRRNSG